MRTTLVAGMACFFTIVLLVEPVEPVQGGPVTHELTVEIGKDGGGDCVVTEAPDDVVTKPEDQIVWHVTNNCDDAKVVTLENFWMLPHALVGGRKGNPVQMQPVKGKGNDAIPAGGSADISATVRTRPVRETEAYKYDVLIDGVPVEEFCILEIQVAGSGPTPPE